MMAKDGRCGFCGATKDDVLSMSWLKCDDTWVTTKASTVDNCWLITKGQWSLIIDQQTVRNVN